MKRYLITGASRGIGRAIAQKLAGPDVELLLHGRDTVALAQTRRTVEPQCAKVTLLVHDLATPQGVANLIAQAGAEPINLLINNAGVAVVKPFTEITPAEWEQTVRVNITAPFLLIQHGEHPLHRGKERFRQLERLLYEQVCAGGFFPVSAPGIARSKNSFDYDLPCSHRHRDLGQGSGRLVA